jgi:hypothetical protein
MRVRGRRVVLAMTSAAVVVVAATLLMFAKGTSLRWKLRGAVAVSIDDFLVGRHVIDDPAEVRLAAERTRVFLESLSRMEASGIVGYLSQISFHWPPGEEVETVSIRLNHMVDETTGAVVFQGDHYYRASSAAWYDYLREMLRPVAGKLLEAWHAPSADVQERLSTASGLALVAPETAGVAEFLRDALSDQGGGGFIFPGGILFLLGEMGSLAAPALESIAATSKVPELRDAARDILEKIRGR